FKESISELFFAPNVTAAAIECNIRIGNAYVNLIHREREKMNEESIESKYGDLNDQAVSDAAARTLKLVELLRTRAMPQSDETGPTEEDAAAEVHPIDGQTPVQPEPKTAKTSSSTLSGFKTRVLQNALSVNRWFLVMSVLLIGASVGVWVWGNYVVREEVTREGVENVIVESSFLAERIKTARISSGTLYGMLLPSWDTLPKEQRQEFLQKAVSYGSEKNYTQVTLINVEGKMAAFGSATRLDVMMP
ncbi:MAG: hypothetical protein ABIV21_06885, partial [Pyrinomonadaceae bacterium]